VIELARRDGRPLRIGHRGAQALAPENTLRSFRAALAAGVDLIEFDVLQLRGGELVLAHSDDLEEVSHGASRGSVRDRSLSELQELAPELPTFDEALSFFAKEAEGVGLHVDLKTGRAAGAVVEALGRSELTGRTLISSSHPGALRRLALIEPRLRTGFTLPRDVFGLSARPRLAPVVEAALRGLRAVTPLLVDPLLAGSKATVLLLHYDLVTTDAVRRAHARGASVVAWTVDDPAELVRVDRAGVDAVVVNDPTIFASTLAL
jgi:glycerophosphoryl diester phosphodiesterase